MNVYFVLSECFESGGSYEPPEPPEWGCIALIVVADSRSKAKYAAMQHDRATEGYEPADWPLCTVRKIGATEGPARVMGDEESKPWWERCDGIKTPVRKLHETGGFNAADVAILGGDPSL